MKNFSDNEVIRIYCGRCVENQDRRTLIGLAKPEAGKYLVGEILRVSSRERRATPGSSTRLRIRDYTGQFRCYRCNCTPRVNIERLLVEIGKVGLGGSLNILADGTIDGSNSPKRAFRRRQPVIVGQTIWREENNPASPSA